MRAPFSEIEPSSSGVLNVTRGVRASASVRLTICVAALAGVPGCTPGAAGWPVGVAGAPGAPGAVPACCCVGATTGLAGGKAYCQPTMINTERTMATMKFFWSI